MFPVAQAGAPAATLQTDALAFFFRAIVLMGAAIAALMSIDSEGVGRRGEYYALMLFSALGMCLMVSASDLVMLALAIEMTTIPLYVLAGFLKRDSRSTEAGMKYFLFGATASAVMWYGFSLIYGLTGQTDLRAAAIALEGGSLPAMLVAIILVLVGLGSRCRWFRSTSGRRTYTRARPHRWPRSSPPRRRRRGSRCWRASCFGLCAGHGAVLGGARFGPGGGYDDAG